jgi:hypothetical protein
MQVQEQEYSSNKTIIVGDIKDPLYENALLNKFVEFGKVECRDPIIAEMLDMFYFVDHDGETVLTRDGARNKISKDLLPLCDKKERELFFSKKN